MRFPLESEVYVGPKSSAQVVLVIVTDDPGRISEGGNAHKERGAVFLSRDGGKHYHELYMAAYYGTRVVNTVTVVVPSGDNVYASTFNRANDTVAFAMQNGYGMEAHLLQPATELPADVYTVEKLTEEQMAKIRSL